MKKKYCLTFLVLLAISLILTYCAPPKITYNIPETASPSDKERMIAELEKGRILYNMNCSKCHTVKKIIPDFTREQLMDYNIRASNPTHIKNLGREALRQEDLDRVLGFLLYKKKNVEKK